MKNSLKTLNIYEWAMEIEDAKLWFQNHGVENIEIVSEYWEPKYLD